ncbi:hypothetical protein ACFLZ9_01810 [Patescibacteria group bacterium]
MPKLTRGDLEKRIRESEIALKKVGDDKKTIKYHSEKISYDIHEKDEKVVDSILRTKYQMPKKLRDVFIEDISGKKLNRLIGELKELPLSNLNRELRFAKKNKIKIPKEIEKKLIRSATVRQKLGVWATIEDREKTEGGPNVGLKRKNPLRVIGQDREQIAEDIDVEGQVSLSQKSGFAMGGASNASSGSNIAKSGSASVVSKAAAKQLAGGVGTRETPGVNPNKNLGGAGSTKIGGPPIGFRPKL